MKQLAFTALLLLTSLFALAQQTVESSATTLSSQAANELAKSPFSYEFVEFPIDMLAKPSRNRKTR